MNWFDRYLVAPFSPQAALRRQFARQSLKALYEAAEPSRYRKVRNDTKSADAQMRKAAQPIRNIARHLDENFDIASGILDVLVMNTVGSGIWPEPQVQLKDGKPAVEVNKQLLKLFEDWRFRPEVTWQHDYGGSQRLAARSWFRDGEVFAQKIIGNIKNIDHGTILPYSIELLEADMVPITLDDPKQGIVQGIEVNAWRRPTAYYAYKTDPTNATYGRLEDMKRMTADVTMHLAFRKRIHQLRGMSVFSSIANRLDDIKDIDEFERVAAKVAASMAAAIKKGDPTAYETPESVGGVTPPMREMGFEAGIIFDDLAPGESIETIDTKRPNNALIPFRDAQLRAAAAGAGASFSSISKNYLGTYSSQRQELVEQDMGYQCLQDAFIYSFAQPVWDGFIDAVKASRRVKFTDDVDTSTVYDCTHTGPQMPWVDPEKEVNAQVVALDRGLTSRSRVIRARGDQPDQINREILRDREELKELGLTDLASPANPDPTAPHEPAVAPKKEKVA